MRAGGRSPLRRSPALPNPASPRRLVTRFQKLAAATVVTAILLVTIGVIVRVTGSGLGCPDWPLLRWPDHPALFDDSEGLDRVDPPDGRGDHRLRGHRARDPRARSTIAIAGRPRRRDGRAVLLVGFQAWLGKETVRLGNSGESVTAHLASAMALVGLLVWILARSLYPARLTGGGSQRFTLRRGVRRGLRLRAAAVRVARDRDVAVVRLPGLAADGRDALPAASPTRTPPRSSIAGSR